MADVIAIGADVITPNVIFDYILVMLLPNSGRCYGHLFCILVVADVIAQWQME